MIKSAIKILLLAFSFIVLAYSLRLGYKVLTAPEKEEPKETVKEVQKTQKIQTSDGEIEIKINKKEVKKKLLRELHSSLPFDVESPVFTIEDEILRANFTEGNVINENTQRMCLSNVYADANNGLAFENYSIAFCNVQIDMTKTVATILEMENGINFVDFDFTGEQAKKVDRIRPFALTIQCVDMIENKNYNSGCSKVRDSKYGDQIPNMTTDIILFDVSHSYAKSIEKLFNQYVAEHLVKYADENPSQFKE